ncbi:MAG TPA: GNAT family N-acetyltransferase [Candidatus Nanopelagicales bacterium]|nr:GNAT family N-acetyltransferase [Candidatus Nanopelagicales bacterium]
MSPAADDHQLSLHRTLLEALDDDPFVRFELDPGNLAEIAAVPGTAVAWVGQHRTGLRWATGLAADPASARDLKVAAELLVDVAARSADAGTPVAGVTISRGGRDLLPAHLRQPEAWEWDLWWTDRAPDPAAYAVPGATVVDLDPADHRIAALLELASPTASIPAGDPRVARWAGLGDPEGVDAPDTQDSGGLVGLVAITHHRSGAHHLNDVATHPARRGRRLARVVCGTVTAQSLESGAPAVTLGMYADNDAARALYAALGFTCVRGQTSGRLRP